MEAANILSADVLDIIFDARNKEYGAYDLRKHYQRRLTKALIVMLLVVVLLLITYLLVAAIKPKDAMLVVDKEVTLEKVKPTEHLVEPPPPPPPPPPQPLTVKTRIFTTPVIVVDPPENERPPEQKDLEDSKIGLANVDGKDDDGTLTPPVEISKGVVEAPKKQGEDLPFTKVEIEAQYPGGLGAWSVFLNRNLVYPQAAIDDEKEGTVYIQFVVDVDGTVSHVEAISGPEELRKAAESVIIKCNKWIPGIQNGHPVKSYKKQPITFKLSQ